MATRDIVVMGGSAGAVEAFQRIISGLPREFPAAVFVVLHFGAESVSNLAPILARDARIRVKPAQDGDAILPGVVYVATPGRHLMLERERVRVAAGPRENRHRPSIDVLFRSAARAFGDRVAGVVLTGLLDDGAMGLQLIKDAGGATIVQDPDDAMFPSMPLAALEVGPEFVVPLDEMPELLARLSEAPAEVAMKRKPARGQSAPPPQRMGKDTGNGARKPGQPAVYTCPECSGTLWEANEGEVTRFECRVGHAYTLPSLVEEHADTVERAMWIALRSLDEGAALAKRMAERAKQRGHQGARKRFAEQAEEKARDATVLREILLRNSRVTTAPEQQAEERRA